MILVKGAKNIQVGSVGLFGGLGGHPLPGKPRGRLPWKTEGKSPPPPRWKLVGITFIFPTSSIGFADPLNVFQITWGKV